MGLVNFYPMIGDENGLPVYVRGIGVGHEQERKRFVTADGTIHLLMTITGCGILTLGEKRKMLPVGTMMLTPPGTLLDLTPAPSGWMDNWIGIVAKDDVVTRFGDGIRVFTPVDPGRSISSTTTSAGSLRLTHCADVFSLPGTLTSCLCMLFQT